MADKMNSFDVELPAGGMLQLLALDEVDLWQSSHKRYVEDYGLHRQNDMVLVGAILSQQITLYRAQQKLNGYIPDIGDDGNPKGGYRRTDLKAAETSSAQSTLQKAAEEIRALEKALGIDKKTREAGSTYTVADYITQLKRASHEYGIHIAKRVKAYESFAMDMRWRIRLLRQGDPEDRSYHNITPDSIIDFAETTLTDLEEIDRKYARETGRLFTGKL